MCNNWLGRFRVGAISAALVLGMSGSFAMAQPAKTVKSDPASGITSTVIKVGWMGDASGPSASVVVPDLHGLQAYADFLNARGGVAGRKLQILDLDDQARADNAFVNFRRLVNDEHVLAIVSISGSQTSTPLSPAILGAKIPVIFPPQTDDTQLKNPYFFNLTSHYADQCDVMVATAARMVGGPASLKLFVVRLNVPSGEEFNGYIQRSLKAQGGQYIGTATTSFSQQDFTPIVVQLKQAIANGANAIAYHGTSKLAIGLMTALQKADISLPFVGASTVANGTAFQEVPVAQLAHLAAVQSILPPSSGVGAAKDMQDYIKTHPQYAEDEQAPFFSQGWLSGWIIAQAIGRAAKANDGAVNRETLDKALSGKFDTDGLTCPLDFTGALKYTPCATALFWDGKTLASRVGFIGDAAVLQRQYGLK